MAFGKRQLILAALVVALGAAVYLNWSFSGGKDLTAVDDTGAAASVGATTSEKELGQAQLVNGPAESGAVIAGTTDDFFAQARLSRQKGRDQAVELLEKILSDAKADAAAKKEAVAQAAVIAQNILRENNIESLIKAKKFPDAVVFLQNGECSVVVKMPVTSQENAIVIKDIVAGQSGCPYDKIKIVESK